MPKAKREAKTNTPKVAQQARARTTKIARRAEAETPRVAVGSGAVGEGLPGDANYLADVQAQYDWQLALTRMIAESWNDPALRELLLEGDPDEVRKLFLKRVNYALPNGVRVTFEAVDVKYIDNPKLNGWAGGLDRLSADVVIKLPPAPEAKYQAKAIADYVATGKAYPFT